jgi:hypothetical protein
MFLSLLATAIAVAHVETTATGTGTRQKIRTGRPILSVVAAAGYSGWKTSCVLPCGGSVNGERSQLRAQLGMCVRYVTKGYHFWHVIYIIRVLN